MRALIIGRTYKVCSIRDYNSLINLLKEHKMPLIKVRTAIEKDTTGKDIEVVTITTQGELRFLEFVEYLFKKEQRTINKLLNKIKIKEA